MKDPYLVPGQLCEVWNDENYWSYYFYKYDEFERPCFSRFKIVKEYEGLPGLYFDNYRPHGTEWDYLSKWNYNPENKNMCSTVDADGRLYIWGNCKEIERVNSIWWFKNRERPPVGNRIAIGICSDKSRYQGDAWKTSLRMRPEWAKKEHKHE